MPYFMTWEEFVAKYHKKYIKEIEIGSKSEAYIETSAGQTPKERIRNGQCLKEDEIKDDAEATA